MWAKLKSSCFHSMTVAWGYLLAVISAGMSCVDYLGDAVGDPSLRDQVSAAIGDPTISARVLIFISAVTILVRLRTAGKDKP